MKHSNCHARSKQKRKKLLLKMRTFWNRVVSKRAAKIRQLNQPKGETIRLKHQEDKASNYAVPYADLFPNGGGGYLFDSNHARTLNQRQRRKLERHIPQRRRI
jgi:hypothetical protein